MLHCVEPILIPLIECFCEYETIFKTLLAHEKENLGVYVIKKNKVANPVRQHL
jgi:hypothetical protein